MVLRVPGRRAEVGCTRPRNNRADNSRFMGGTAGSAVPAVEHDERPVYTVRRLRLATF